MVNVTTILDRTSALEQKYAKYLEEDQPQKKQPVAKGDQYQAELDELDQETAELAEEAAQVGGIRERAKVALKNAEIRKRKASLNDRIAGLEGLAKKGKVSKDMLKMRLAQIEALQDRVVAIPDGGVSTTRKKPGAASNRSWLTGTKASEVRIELGDMGGSNGDANYYQDTEENVAFRQEFDTRKQKQDVALDEIEQGVGRLGDIATDMGTELTKQDRLLDAVETNMDTATRSVQTNNQKMKGVLKRVASTRNFCIDIILITVLLAVAGYIYTLVA